MTDTLGYSNQLSQDRARTDRKRPYRHENERELDEYLQGDHSEEIYSAFCDDRADQH